MRCAAHAPLPALASRWRMEELAPHILALSRQTGPRDTYILYSHGLGTPSFRVAIERAADGGGRMHAEALNGVLAPAAAAAPGALAFLPTGLVLKADLSEDGIETLAAAICDAWCSGELTADGSPTVGACAAICAGPRLCHRSTALRMQASARRAQTSRVHPPRRQALLRLLLC